MRDDCPCARCRGDAGGDERALHAAIRGLLAYVERPRWPFFCAQLDQPALFGASDDDLLAQICEVPASAIAQQRTVEWDFARAKQSRLEQLAGDRPTAELLWHYWQRRLDWRAELTTGTGRPHDLLLVSNGRPLRLRCPDSLESFLVLFEIFLAEPYRDLPPVARIYDLGAHIGLAALYLHARQPRAELICVEPVASSAALLEENLARNGVPGRVLRCAVGAAGGELTLNVYPATSLSSRHALTELTGQPLGQLTTSATAVQCRSFAEVVTGADYGLKVDIEGAEHDLLAAPQVVAGARWTVGELHLGPAIVAPGCALDLPRLLAQHGLLELDGPGVFGNSVTYTFRAVRPTRLFAR